MRATLLMLAAVVAVHASDVEGRIVNTVNGHPVKRAAVSLRGVPSVISTAPAENYTCQTDSEGRFVVRDVAPGAYEVNALREGFQKDAPNVARQIVVRAGHDVKDVELRLVPLGAVSGRVVDEHGAAIADAQVVAMRYRYTAGRRELRYVESTQTDDRGQYRIGILPPGRWYLQTRKSGSDPGLTSGMVTEGAVRERVWETTYYGGTAEPSQAQLIELSAGAQLEHLDIVMPRVPVYAIRVQAPNGARVSILRLAAGMHGFTTRTLDTPGRVEIYGLPRGRYTLEAQIDARFFTGRQIAIRRMEVTDHDIDGVDLVTPTAVEISGRIAGVPLENLRVRLRPDEEGPQRVMETQVRPDGSFTLSAHPGDYIVEVGEPGSVYLSDVRIGKRSAADHRLTVGKDSGALQLTASNELGKVEGVVETAAGAPAVRALVTLVPDQSLPFWLDLYKTARTNTSGAFSIEGVVPGKYRVYAWVANDTELPMDPEFRRQHEDGGADVSVAPSGSAAVKLVAQ
jgi:hypothetical protein